VIAGAASRSHASARGSSSLAPSSHSLRNTGSSSAEARERPQRPPHRVPDPHDPLGDAIPSQQLTFAHTAAA
jgi:hypothetical protein